ncbi:hypothetical protein TPENAI_10217 [Tenacibaculum litopenaei]|uniref:hypothetical protein n=1 Tax=Tenacibaculum litopenaei TaxID=396016 RepID=UPI00389615E9
MIDVLTPPNEKLAILQNELEKKIAQLENLSQRSVDNLLFEEYIDTVPLISLTGYYKMNRPNGDAFLSINTIRYRLNIVVKGRAFRVHIPVVTVAYSMDGKKSREFSFQDITSFNGEDLIIGNLVRLNFTRNYERGRLVTFSGSIYEQGKEFAVTGSSHFNPVPMKTFIGTYKEMDFPREGEELLNITDSKVFFDFGDGLEEVTDYSYTPAMYILEFYKPHSLRKYTVMFATSGKNGLVCRVVDDYGSRFAVTIP